MIILITIQLSESFFGNHTTLCTDLILIDLHRWSWKYKMSPLDNGSSNGHHGDMPNLWGIYKTWTSLSHLPGISQKPRWLGSSRLPLVLSHPRISVWKQDEWSTNKTHLHRRQNHKLQYVLDTVQCRYSAVNVLKKFLKNTPHSSPVRARYGVVFVDPACDWYSASVPAIQMWCESSNV